MIRRFAFASETSVPVNRTKEEIDRLLEKNGAAERMFAVKPEAAVVGFCVGGRAVRITLPLPTRQEARAAHTRGSYASDKQVTDRLAQLERQCWRVLLLVLKAKLEAIAGGISTVEQEFLAWTVLPGGATVGETIIPQMVRNAPLCLPAPKEQP